MTAIPLGPTVKLRVGNGRPEPVPFLPGTVTELCGRKYGFNADSVREADVVNADGELLRVSPYGHPDLFWGLKGGGGYFGIVTSMEFALYLLTSVFGGNLFYPLERSAEVLDLYNRWIDALPDEMTTAVAFMNFPPLPAVPEPLRGKSFISVRGCYWGDPQ